MPPSRVRWLTAASCFVSLTVVAGCSSSPSYATLAKLAHSVPTPPGLTYVREVDHVNRAEFGHDDQKEVDLIYSNTTMTCEQLSAVWRETTRKSGWRIEDNASGAGAFDLKKNGIPITVDPGGTTGTCPDPRIAVGKTP